MVGNEGVLNHQEKKLTEQYLVNSDCLKDKKGGSYDLPQLAYYVGYELDLRTKERQKAADTLNDLSKEKCPHKYSHFLYDQEGEAVRDEKGSCDGHEGKYMEYWP